MFVKKKKHPPVIIILILVAAILWLLQDLGTIATNIPWLPIIIIVAVLGKMAYIYKK